VIIRHAHQSGRFDATPDQQAAMLARFTAACSVGVVTEAGGIERAPEGWDMVGDETKISGTATSGGCATTGRS
jgi:hypothetical protein